MSERLGNQGIASKPQRKGDAVGGESAASAKSVRGRVSGVLVRNWLVLVIGTAAFVSLYEASHHNYLLFHGLAEGFSIVVACGVFMMAWNSRRLVQDDYLLFVGVAYLFVAVFDGIHTLAYSGMGVFDESYGTNLPTQIWIAARYVESLSLLAAPLFIRRRLRLAAVLPVYLIVSVALVFSIFHGSFPTCFADASEGGSGLTTFKVASEYVIALILVASALALRRSRAALDPGVYRLVIAPIVVTVASEMAFTLYKDAYGVSNLIGHFLKIVSFYLIYKAVIATGLIKPYDLLFRNLKDSEERARLQHDYLRSVLEAIPHPFYVIDARDYTVKVANSAARAGPLTDSSTCHGLTHGSEKPCAANDHSCPLEELKRTRQPATVEHIHRSAEGAPRHVEVHGYPILDDDGNVVEMIEYCYDVTERSQAGKKIEDLARFPSENTSPVMRVDGSGVIIYANEASCDMLKEWESEAGGKVPERWRAAVARAIEEGGPRSVDTESGGCTYSVAIAPVPEAGYANLYATDITERRQAEEKIMDLARFPSENTSPVMRVDASGVIIYANEASDDLLREWGTQLGGMVPKPWRAAVAGGIEDGSSRSMDTECGDRTYSVTIAPVAGAGYANLYATDVTERNRAEEGLRRARDELERRVEERTAELRASQEQLLQSQKMEAIGRLAGGIAHDFNNMMQVVTGYAHRVIGGLEPDDPKRKSVEGIRQAGLRAAALTHQLLAFSRKQILRPTVIDLNGVVSDIREMLERTLGDDIVLVMVLPPELGRVKADRGQIEQAIMNLAINARDAMPRGGKLTIETANVELGDSGPQDEPAVSPGRYVMLAVRDTGCGMDEETQSQIFEPFFSTKKPGEGTGLGLSTVYGTIHQSGGVMRVQSEPGRGTALEIYLPRVKGAIEPHVAEQAGRGPREGTETILLVEDDDNVRSLVAVELRERGYTVLEACNGGEAILKGKTHESQIDLVVTDVVLPGRSGRETYEGVLAFHPGAQVLYMSGHDERHVAHRGVLDPGTCFLAKPFTDDQLAIKVREALDGTGMAAG